MIFTCKRFTGLDKNHPGRLVEGLSCSARCWHRMYWDPDYSPPLVAFKCLMTPCWECHRIMQRALQAALRRHCYFYRESNSFTERYGFLTSTH